MSSTYVHKLLLYVQKLDKKFYVSELLESNLLDEQV